MGPAATRAHTHEAEEEEEEGVEAALGLEVVVLEQVVSLGVDDGDHDGGVCGGDESDDARWLWPRHFW